MSVALKENDPLKKIGRDPFLLVLSYMKVKERIRYERVSKEWKDIFRKSWSQITSICFSDYRVDTSVPKEILECIWKRCSPYLKNLRTHAPLRSKFWPFIDETTMGNIVTLLEKNPARQLDSYDLRLDAASFHRFLVVLRKNHPEKIRKLHLSGGDLKSESFISALVLCTSLEDLVLNTASEALLQAIPSSLRSLSLVTLGGQSLSLLNTPSLRSLIIKIGCREPLDLAPLRNCKQLRSLEIYTGLYFSPLNGGKLSFGNLAGLPLEELTLIYDNDNFLDLTSRALDAPIQNCLKRLNIRVSVLDPVHQPTLQSIAVFVALEELDLSNSAVDGDTMSVIAQNCPRLRSLQLASTKINDTAMDCIGKNCKDLRTLDIDSCSHVSDKGILSLLERFQPSQHKSDPCCQLTSVNLSATNITDLALAGIGRKCKRLHTLDISYCSLLTDKAMVNLLETDDKGATIGEHLKSLMAHDTALGNESFGAIGEKCMKLEILQNINSEISDTGVERFTNQPTKELPLKTLDISGAKITDKSLPQIGRKFSKMDYLDVSYCETITDAGIEMLVAARFPPNRNTSNLPILTINIDDTGITDREYHPKIKITY